MGELVPGIANIEPVKRLAPSAVLTFRRSAREVPPLQNSRDVGADTVSATDKAKNKAQELGGKAREAVGRVTGDRTTEVRGKDDQTTAHLKGAGEKIKDAFKK
jgi:uncharacterized protein YjbJ (UPF0337 family)